MSPLLLKHNIRQVLLTLDRRFFRVNDGKVILKCPYTSSKNWVTQSLSFITRSRCTNLGTNSYGMHVISTFFFFLFLFFFSSQFNQMTRKGSF